MPAQVSKCFDFSSKLKDVEEADVIQDQEVDQLRVKRAAQSESKKSKLLIQSPHERSLSRISRDDFRGDTGG